MLALNAALVGRLRSVAEGVDATESVDLTLSGNSTRCEAVESAKKQDKSMEMNANFIFGIFPASTMLKGRCEYNVQQCEEVGFRATLFDDELLMNSVKLLSGISWLQAFRLQPQS